MSEYRLVDQIYEAAAIPELWPDVLQQFAERAGAAGGAVLAFGNQELRWRASADFQPVVQDYLEQVAARYGGRDPRTVRLLGLSHRGFMGDLDVFTEAELLDNPMKNEFWLPRGLGWGIATHVNSPSGETIVFHAERGFGSGPHDADTAERLNSLRPHLARAAMLSNRISFERIRTAVETLTAIGLPAAAITKSSKVLLANESFLQVKHVWTTRAGDRLALLDDAANGQLADTLSALGLADGPFSIPVRNADAELAGVVQLVPIRLSARDIFTSTAAIVVLSEAGAGIASSTLVEALLDLTPAELVVAKEVAAGYSSAQIAKRMGRSVTTIRNQVKSAMAKTGCSRQIELALLLRQFPAAHRMW